MVDLLNRNVGVGEMHHGLDADHVLHPVGDVDSEIGGGTPRSPSEIGGVLHPVVSHHTLHPLERPPLLHSLIFFLYVGISFFDFFDFLYPPARIKYIYIYVCLDSSLESIKHIFKNNESGQTFFLFNYWATV